MPLLINIAGALTTNCLVEQAFGLPFCYDKFTTSYLLPDNSYGTLHTGNYTSYQGDTANLISGDYKIGDRSGNLYAGTEARKPNPANPMIPSQWTSSGVGSALAPTALGIGATIIRTITGPITLPAVTIQPTTLPANTVSKAAIRASIIPGTTIAATTYAEATTLTTTDTLMPTEMASTLASKTRKGNGNVRSWDKMASSLSGLTMYLLCLL
jgi:hypothetical protein